LSPKSGSLLNSFSSISMGDVCKFSALVSHKKYEQAMQDLIVILASVARQNFSVTGTALEEKEALRTTRTIMSVLASGITALISDPNFNLNESGFRAFIGLKHSLRKVFACTSFNDMSHIIGLLGDLDGDQVTIGSKQIPKIFLTSGLESIDTDTFTRIERMQEDVQLIVWLALLDNRYLLLEAEESNLNRLLDMADQIKPTAFHSSIEILCAARVWFSCSFWSNERKHRIKPLLNECFKLTAERHGVFSHSLISSAQEKNGRRTVLVVMERWGKAHAMTRVFSKAFRNLANHFRLIALLPRKKPEDQSDTEYFDQILYVDDVDENKKEPGLDLMSTDIGDFLEGLVKKIESVRPDMIIFSSLGMHFASIFLAQFRLAPIQVLLPGHPASSFSENIDYLILEEHVSPAPETVTEKLVVSRPLSMFSFTPPNKEMLVRKAPKERDTVKIICNSMLQKMTPSFIKVCQKINDEAHSKVSFDFLIGSDVLTKVAIQELLEMKLENVRVHRYMPYIDYARIIGSCDLQLTPFPFGNTNSFIDALVQGVPTICLDGPEMHSRGDAGLGKLAGLPEFCQATSEEKYVEAAVRLINDREERERISEQILSLNHHETVFKDSDDMEFFSAVNFVFDNHEKMQSSAQKFWYRSIE